MLNKKMLQEIDMKALSDNNRKIENFLRSVIPSMADNKLYFALVYAAYLSSEYSIDNTDDLFAYIEKNISEQRALFVKETTGKFIDAAFKTAKEFAKSDLVGYLFVYPGDTAKLGGECRTPDSISKLAVKILGIKKEDTLADFGCGTGDFIIQAADMIKNNSIFGIEINTFSYEISKIRTELFTKDADIELGDMFALSDKKKFEKIFSNYPFGMRLHHLQTGTEYIEELHRRIPEIKKATSSDWIYNSLVFDHLTEDGKAVVVMTNGSTWNSIDQKIREYYVRKGFVEAVIALPSKLFEGTAIPTTMMVLSRNNKSVRMVDATNLCEQGRRENIITDSNIDTIIDLLENGGDGAVIIDTKQIREKEFFLNPSRYIEKAVEIEDGVEFGSLMKRITRGAPIKAAVLDEMVSDEPTDTQYLMLANIQKGMISEDLPYLKELDTKLNKYCIGNRNLLLSKNGAPFKVAVAEIEENRKILGNGNLFIIELDETKVNPYFLKAFFDSETGEAALSSIAVGSTMPNISAESLKKLIVPLPSLDKQNEVANLYQAKQDEIKVLQLKILKAQNELRGIFGEVE